MPSARSLNVGAVDLSPLAGAARALLACFDDWQMFGEQVPATVGELGSMGQAHIAIARAVAAVEQEFVKLGVPKGRPFDARLVGSSRVCVAMDSLLRLVCAVGPGADIFGLSDCGPLAMILPDGHKANAARLARIVTVLEESIRPGAGNGAAAPDGGAILTAFGTCLCGLSIGQSWGLCSSTGRARGKHRQGDWQRFRLCENSAFLAMQTGAGGER
jgi:hypothetical protein